MELLDQLTTTQWIIAALGSIGLLIAARFVVTVYAKRPSLDETTPTEVSAPSSTTDAEALPHVPSPNAWRAALAKTRRLFGIGESKDIASLKEAFEEACLAADLGFPHTQEALAAVDWARIEGLPSSERSAEVRRALQTHLKGWLEAAMPSDARDWPRRHASGEPTVVWFVGVNGVGKTTSIAKLASELKGRGHSVLLGAGDTFRAAAGEQLETWAQRLEIPIVKGQAGADASAVLFDAIQSAKAKNIDFVLCDSAGRLHNQNQLMEALQKNKRVMDKALAGAPHEILLVLDGNTGQNMVSQAESFLKDVAVTGLILTKLDGTARGGAVFSVARKTKLPIRRLGLGETAVDFRAFDAEAFSEAVLGDDTRAPASATAATSNEARL